MKFRVSILLVLLTLTSFFRYPKTTRADFESDYQGHLQTYQAYRDANNFYLIKRNQYLQFKTLNSQTEALAATKDFLEKRDLVLLSYISLLRTKNADSTFSTLLDEEYAFLNSHKDQVGAIGSLDDAVRHSDKAKERHIPFQGTSRKITATFILAKITTLKSTLDSLILEGENLAQTLRTQGKDPSTVERWMIEAKNKNLQTDRKIIEIQQLIANLKARDANQILGDYNKIQVALFEANQYIREAANFLNEYKESIKYGKY